MTAEEARKLSRENYKKPIYLNDIFGRINKAAEEGSFSIRISTDDRDFTEAELEHLSNLGYAVSYSRPLLEYEIAW